MPQLPETSNTNATGFGRMKGAAPLCMADQPVGALNNWKNKMADSMFYAAENNKLFWILFFGGILQVKLFNQSI